MKLSEIAAYLDPKSPHYNPRYHDRDDDDYDGDDPVSSGFIIKNADFMEPEDSYYGTMNIEVDTEYEEGDESVGVRGGHDITKAVLADECKQYDDEDGDESSVKKVWPKGTNLYDMPGYNKDVERQLEKAMEKHFK